MAAQDITTFSFKNLFVLSAVTFEKACVVNRPEQVDAYSIYWIKEGKGVYNIDFESYEFDQNVLFFLSPGQVFSVDSEQIKTAYKLAFKRDFYCIQTHDKAVACNGVLFNNIYESPFVKPSQSDSNKLEFILENLIEEFNTEEAAQYDMLQAYLKQFIIQSVRIKNEKYQIKTSLETKLFKDFSLLVDQHYKTLHSVSDYAQRLGLSPKSISKHFQKAGLQKPSDYIKNRIVLEAKRLLIYSDNSVKQIAYELGFNDPAYFTRFFSKSASQSPLQFKKEH